MITFAGAFQPVQPIRFAGSQQTQVGPVLMDRLKNRLAEAPEIYYVASEAEGDEVIISRKENGEAELMFVATDRTIVLKPDGTIAEATIANGKLNKDLAKSVVESFLSIFFEDPHPQKPKPEPKPAQGTLDRGDWDDDFF